VYVQPYFPEPETVHGNIANEQYDVRLRFIRKVADRHFVTVMSATGLAWAQLQLPEAIPPLWTDIVLLAVALAISSILRMLGPGKATDKLSQLFLPIVVFLSARLGAALILADIDCWAIPVASLCMWLYTRMCGRDFSFVGLFGFGLSATLLVIFGAAFWTHRPYVYWGTGLPFAIVWISYISYDSASLMQRRRANEVWMAVLDLFRDCLNIFTYGFRVIQHLRTFRI